MANGIHWTANCPVPHLNDMLALLVRKVLTPPLTSQEGFPSLLSQKYAWLLDAVSRCTRRVIDEGVANSEAKTAILNQALDLIEKAKDQRGFRVHNVDEVQDALRRQPIARRSFIAYKILTSTRRRHFLSGRTFSRPITGDDEWVLAKAENTANLAESARLVQGAVEVWAMTSRQVDMKERLEAAVTTALLNDDQKDDLRNILNPTAVAPDNVWEDEHRKRKAGEAKIRTDSKARLLENIAGIRDGSDFSALFYLVREMRQAPSASNSNWGQTNIAHIERVYGKPIAEAFRAGLSAHWRRFTPALRSELERRNNVENGVLTGLTALALDFRDGVDFTALSAQDAATATHYALREMNQFPRWFAAVAMTHPDVVGPLCLTGRRCGLPSESKNLRKTRKLLSSQSQCQSS